MAEKRINLGGGRLVALKIPFLEQKKYKKFFKQQNGFSIAEAFIVLSIVSVIMGVSAPLISKTIKNQNFSDAQFSLLKKNISDLKVEVNSRIETNKSDLDSKINKVMPIGSIIMWSGSNVPENWALCNGNNGTPDLRDRFIVGSGNAYNIGATGGSNSVTLTVSNMPKHSHDRGTMEIEGSIINTDINEHFTYSDSLQTTGAFKSTPKAVNSDNSGNGAGAGGAVEQINFKASDGWTGSTSEVGSGTAHENRPPYYALAFIMRVK